MQSHLEFGLSSAGMGCAIQIANSTSTESDLRVIMGAYVPAVKFDRSENDYLDIATVALTTTSVTVTRDSGVIFASKVPSVPDAITSLPHLVYSLLFESYIRRGLFPVHSSCVIRDGIATLLVGMSGTGKTSTALNLVRDFGFEWFSGNKTLLSFAVRDGERAHLVAAGGTPTISLNSKDESMISRKVDVRYSSRILFQESPADVATHAGYKVGAVFLLGGYGKKGECELLDRQLASIILLPLLFDPLNVDVHFAGTSKIFSPLAPTLSERQEAGALLASALEHTPVYRTQGDLVHVASKIGRVVR